MFDERTPIHQAGHSVASIRLYPDRADDQDFAVGDMVRIKSLASSPTMIIEWVGRSGRDKYLATCVWFASDLRLQRADLRVETLNHDQPAET